MGDLNINLLNTNLDNNVTDFFDSMASNLLIPFIIHPTRVALNSSTIIDNIFSDLPNHKNSRSGNLSTHITNHYTQYLLIPFKKKTSPVAREKFIRNTKNIDTSKFQSELLTVDWNNLINIEAGDINNSFSLLETNINNIFDKHFPLKKQKTKQKGP
jgi:hypothetical protein